VRAYSRCSTPVGRRDAQWHYFVLHTGRRLVGPKPHERSGEISRQLNFKTEAHVATQLLRLLCDSVVAAGSDTGSHTCPALLLVFEEARGGGSLCDIAGFLWVDDSLNANDTHFDAEEGHGGLEISDDVAGDCGACAHHLPGALGESGRCFRTF
jgi:hypothetical protein